MKMLSLGEVRVFRKTVQSSDQAHFEAGAVHNVYATFALARDAEWSGRLFVLEMKEDGEEGIGTALTIEHLSPAFEGQVVVFTATLLEINQNEIVTSFEAKMEDRLLATGIQKQKILPKSKIDSLFDKLRNC